MVRRQYAKTISSPTGDEHGETTLKEAIAVSLKDEADNLSDVFLVGGPFL
jgi:hypothetical protein